MSPLFVLSKVTCFDVIRSLQSVTLLVASLYVLVESRDSLRLTRKRSDRSSFFALSCVEPCHVCRFFVLPTSRLVLDIAIDATDDAAMRRLGVVLGMTDGFDLDLALSMADAFALGFDETDVLLICLAIGFEFGLVFGFDKVFEIALAL